MPAPDLNVWEMLRRALHPQDPTATEGDFGLGIVGTAQKSVSATFTRPNDATPYAALDTVADSTSSPNVLQFAGAARANGLSGLITKAQLITDQPTNTAQFRLHLFNTTPTPINDNAPYQTAYTNATTRIGTIDIGPIAQEASGGTAATGQNTSTLLPYVCAPGDTKMYGIVEALTAFTPASVQNLVVKLTLAQD